MIHHINKLKDKNHMIISIDAEKGFDKLHHPFMIKTPKDGHRKGTSLNIVESIYDKPSKKRSCMDKRGHDDYEI